MKKRSILFAALCIVVAIIGMSIQKYKTENLETGVSSYPATRPVAADEATSPSINHTRGLNGENVTGGAVVQKHFTSYEMGLRGGDYTLQWSGGGSEVNGKFTGRTSSSVSNLTVQ